MTDEVHAALQIDNAVISVKFIGVLLVSVGGFAMSAMGFLIKRQDERITKLENQLSEKVDKDAHDKALDEIRRETKEALNANIEAINRSSQNAIEAITKVHARVDDLYKLIADRK